MRNCLLLFEFAGGQSISPLCNDAADLPRPVLRPALARFAAGFAWLQFCDESCCSSLKAGAAVQGTPSCSYGRRTLQRRGCGSRQTVGLLSRPGMRVRRVLTRSFHGPPRPGESNLRCWRSCIRASRGAAGCHLRDGGCPGILRCPGASRLHRAACSPAEAAQVAAVGPAAVRPGSDSASTP